MSDQPFSDDLDLESPLREAVLEILAEPIPTDLASRVIQRAGSLRTAPPKNGQRRARRILVTSVLAAAALLAVTLFNIQKGNAWTQVVNAISNRPWLHAKGTSFDKKTVVEFWFSAQDGIIVQRQGEQVWLFDLRQQIWDSYKLAGSDDNVVYRTPLMAENRGGVDGVRNVFAAMLVGDLRNTFTNGAQREVEYTQQDVAIGDASVQELRVKIQSPQGTLTESLFRVDPETLLPTWWRFEGPVDAEGAKLGWQCDIDYPETGPKTIYGAGVPANAPLIDRIPKGDERLLSNTSLARKRGDSYYAVVVASNNSDTRHPEALLCWRVWRKGNKWRVEFCRSPQNGKSLPPGIDPSKWWKQHVEQIRSYPDSIFDGKQECTYSPVSTNRPDPQDPNWVEIVSFNRSYHHLRPTDPWPNNNLPEFNARQQIDLGLPGDKVTVDWEPQDGPAGSVRVEYLKAKANPGEPSGRRYWIDPQKDYLVVQNAHLKLAANGQHEQLDPVAEVIEVCTSPSGRMYPTLVRMHNGSVSIGTEEKSDRYQHFFYDFSASIPDELFDTSK